ncbi:MAG: hypothetical protein AAF125_10375, partial [Chloroflexota bacterium]
HYDGAFGDDGPTPHVTVGVFNAPSKQAAAELPAYDPLTYTVDRLYVNTGNDEKILPWLVYDVVHLRGPLARSDED